MFHTIYFSWELSSGSFLLLTSLSGTWVETASCKNVGPSEYFSSDEVVACRLVTNEIQFLDPRDFSRGFVNRLRVPVVAALELSMAPGTYVAAFVLESKVYLQFRKRILGYSLINNLKHPCVFSLIDK
ncbi:hypothetical protein P3S67_003724 [Capsicum chacoense]